MRKGKVVGGHYTNTVSQSLVIIKLTSSLPVVYICAVRVHHDPEAGDVRVASYHNVFFATSRHGTRDYNYVYTTIIICTYMSVVVTVCVSMHVMVCVCVCM